MDASFLQGAVDTADLTTYTFASQNLGTADADRHIVVCIEARSASSMTVSSVTVGGVSATIVQQQQSGGNVCALAIAAVPSGTTGDVVVTLSAGAVRAAIQMYRLVGLDSATPHDSDASGATSPSVALDIPAGGVAIGGGVAVGGSATAAWTGLTEDYETNVESQIVVTSAHDMFGTAQTGHAIAITFSGSFSLPAGVFASWAPTSGTAPTITSDLTAEGFKDEAFSYQIEATGDPATFTYGASNLPAGLSINTSTGVISGTPTDAVYTADQPVVITADNGVSPAASENLIITIWELAETTAADATTAQRTGLTASTTYKSFVVAFNAAGESSRSNEQEVATAAGTVPEGFGVLSAVAVLAAEGARDSEGTGALSAVASLSAAGEAVTSGSGVLSAVATLEAVGEAPGVGVSEGSGVLSAIATMQAEGQAEPGGSGTLSAVALLSAEGARSSAGTAELIAIAELVAVGSVQHLLPPPSRYLPARRFDQYLPERRTDQYLEAR